MGGFPPRGGSRLRYSLFPSKSSLSAEKRRDDPGEPNAPMGSALGNYKSMSALPTPVLQK